MSRFVLVNLCQVMVVLFLKVTQAFMNIVHSAIRRRNPGIRVVMVIKPYTIVCHHHIVNRQNVQPSGA